MKREIKFRVWDKRNKVFAYPEKMGSTFAISISGIITTGYIDGDMTTTENKDFILLQFTGLKDNNGVEIYEGDICKSFECLGIAKFIMGGFDLFDANDHPLGYEEEFLIGSCTVIGNIYENPELIK